MGENWEKGKWGYREIGEEKVINDMVKERDEYYTVRLNWRSKEEHLNYLKLETALCVKGRDINEYLAEVIETAVERFYDEEEYKNLCAGIVLIKEVERRFGVGLTRLKLFTLRNSVWTEGVEYYSAPSGGSRIFRYDLEKCLPAIKDLRKGK